MLRPNVRPMPTPRKPGEAVELNNEASCNPSQTEYPIVGLLP